MARGIRFAQSGFSTKDPDYRQAFDSSWPLMNILYSGPFSVERGGIIYEHKLGWYPAYMIFTEYGYNFSTAGSKQAGTSTLVSGLNSLYFGMNDQNLRYSPSALAPATMKGYLYIFNVDLERDYQAPDNQLGILGPREREVNRGVKFTREGSTTASDDYRDYTVRSDVSSPMVHSVNYGRVNAATSTTVDIPHDLGYAPRVLTYARFESYSDPLSGLLNRYVLGADALSVIAGDRQISVSMDFTDQTNYSVVILKQPS